MGNSSFSCSSSRTLRRCLLWLRHPPSTWLPPLARSPRRSSTLLRISSSVVSPLPSRRRLLRPLSVSSCCSRTRESLLLPRLRASTRALLMSLCVSPRSRVLVRSGHHRRRYHGLPHRHHPPADDDGCWWCQRLQVQVLPARLPDHHEGRRCCRPLQGCRIQRPPWSCRCSCPRRVRRAQEGLHRVHVPRQLSLAS